MDKSIIFQRRELLVNTVIKNLEKRHFIAHYCKNKEEAVEKILKIIPEGSSIGWGGSVTLDEIGIKDRLSKYKVIDRDNAKSKEERENLVLEGMRADYFLMSTNALSEDGELVNIDGHGNRLSALCFGPKKVVMVVGMNKIVKTLDDALSRARNTAAPINAKRVSEFFEMATPCISTGSCADCKSKTSICAQILTTRLCWPEGRIEVVLVNEDLGY